MTVDNQSKLNKTSAYSYLNYGNCFTYIQPVSHSYLTLIPRKSDVVAVVNPDETTSTSFEMIWPTSNHEKQWKDKIQNIQ